jgi:hypothetical protein
MTVVEERMDRLEEALMKLAYAQFNTKLELWQLSKEMRDFKDESKRFQKETSKKASIRSPLPKGDGRHHHGLDQFRGMQGQPITLSLPVVNARLT